MSSVRKSKVLCAGCRDDWYNHNRGMNEKPGCWSFDDAEVVTRYRLAWHLPTVAKNCDKVKTLSCYHAPGRFAFLKEKPRA